MTLITGGEKLQMTSLLHYYEGPSLRVSARCWNFGHLLNLGRFDPAELNLGNEWLLVKSIAFDVELRLLLRALK